MSNYLWILATDRPYDIGVDTSNRDFQMFSCNFTAMAQGPVASWTGEIAKLISDAGLGTLGTSLFIGSKAIIPSTGSGPFTHIYDSSAGMLADETHNGGVYERLSCQIVVRAATYGAAETRAIAIWRELNGQRNVSVTA